MQSSNVESMRYERRKHIRVRVFNGQVRLRLTGLDEWTARVVDISEGGIGCVFRANDPYTEPLNFTLNVKDPLEILLDRGPREKELTVQAEIRAMDKREDEPHAWSVGLRFIITGDEAARNVQSALLRLAMIRLRNSIGVTESGARAAASESGSFPAVSRPRRKLGEILASRGLVTEKIIADMVREGMGERAAGAAGGEAGERLGQRLIKTGLVDGDAVAEALAVQAGVEFFKLKDFQPDRAAVHLLPDTYRNRWNLLPIESNRRTIHLVVANLPDPATQRLIEERCGRRVKYSIGNEARIAELLVQVAALEKQQRAPGSSGLSLLQPKSSQPSEPGVGGGSRTGLMAYGGPASASGANLAGPDSVQDMLTSRGNHLRENRPAVIYQFRAGNGANLHAELLVGRLKTCDAHSIRVVGPVWDDRLLPADILTAAPLTHVEIRSENTPGHVAALIGRPTQITHVVGAFFLIEFLIVRMSESDMQRYQAFLPGRR